MFLINSCSHHFTATDRGLRSKSFTLAGVPSPEVTVPFCLVPSPEFSQAPWDSHPAYLCRFTVRTANELPRGFSWRHGVSELVWPKPHFPAGLGLTSSGFAWNSPYANGRTNPSVRTPILPRHPIGITRVDRCRNVDLLPIGYAFRPRLRIRLTLSGLTFLRKP